MTPNVSRKDGNAFIEALNARALCACATIRQLVQLGTPGPYLPCDVHTESVPPDMHTHASYGIMPGCPVCDLLVTDAHVYGIDR
jgi:hypothetical protein